MRDIELKHGYTYASVERIAQKAASESKWRFVDLVERYEIARSAVAEELYRCDEPPGPYHLIDHGMKAIRRHVEELGDLRGVYFYKRGIPRMPRFEIFWWSVAGPTPSPEEPVIERLTVETIFAKLTPLNQQVLLALADFDNFDRAAEAMGVSVSSYRTYVYLARKQFLRLWHDGEEPSKFWGRTTKRNKSRSVTATTIRRRRVNRLKKQAEGQAQESNDLP